MKAHRLRLLDASGYLPDRFILTKLAGELGTVVLAELEPLPAWQPHAHSAAIGFRVASADDRADLIRMNLGLKRSGSSWTVVAICDDERAKEACVGHCDVTLLADDEYRIAKLALYACERPYSTAAHLLIDAIRVLWTPLATSLVALALSSQCAISSVKSAAPVLGISRWTLRRRLRADLIAHPDAVFGAAVAGITMLLMRSTGLPSSKIARTMLRCDPRRVDRLLAKFRGCLGTSRWLVGDPSDDLPTFAAAVADCCDRMAQLDDSSPQSNLRETFGATPPNDAHNSVSRVVSRRS